MDQFWAIVSVGLGFILRIGIPVLLTIIIGNALRKLDKKWQEDGQKININELSFSDRVIKELHCWEFYECSETKRANCKMQGQAEEPCWQLSIAVGGDPAECLSCKYKEFMDKEIPSTVNLIIRD